MRKEEWQVNAEKRAILLTDYLACGRASEVGLSSFNPTYFSDLHRATFTNWMEIKVSRQKAMCFMCFSSF